MDENGRAMDIAFPNIMGIDKNRRLDRDIQKNLHKTSENALNMPAFLARKPRLRDNARLEKTSSRYA